MQFSDVETDPNKKGLDSDKYSTAWMKSLFFKFFLALISISLVPSALVAVLTVAAYRLLLERSNIPAEEIEIFSQNLKTQAILVFLFITVIAFFVAFLLSRSITKPLRTLTSAVHRIAAGNLDFRFNVTRQDEIGTLGYFFNDMVHKLKGVHERQLAISRVKSEFVSITAHQLRTPLSAMKWSMGMILDGDLGTVPDKQKRILKETYRENERMIRLVGDLLNVARIEEGKFGYEFAPVNINSFLQELIQLYAMPAEKKKINVHLKLPKKQYTIYADVDRLNLALGNIIDNAIHYSGKGKKIIITLDEESKDFVHIAIKDEGVGIREEYQHRIFSKFFRAANIIQMETEGSGLGLFIARNVVLQHGGKIYFASTPEEGTTFHIELPVKLSSIPEKEASFEEFMEAF